MNLAGQALAHPPEAPAVVDAERRVSYGELCAEAAKARSVLLSAGVQGGDRVGLSLGNTVEFVSWYLATLGMGAVAVPLNPLEPAASVAENLEAVQAKVLVAGLFDASSVPDGCVAVDPAGQHLGGPALEAVTGDAPPVVECDGDDLAVLVFTSGTAGMPKAAMLTHGNLDYNFRQAEAHGDILPEADDVLLGVAPLFHVLGVHVVLGATIRQGASVVLADRFDPVACAELVVEEGITVLMGVPAMWQGFIMAGLSTDTFARVRRGASGAARLEPALARQVADQLGIELIEGYGLTEASAIVTTGAGVPAPPGSIGVPIPGMEIRLVDSAGEDVLVGDPGEILLRGGNVFPGYWADEEATAKVLSDEGWLSTGDIAVVDDDGFLYIVDRAKDLIIVSGFNVSPAEVELQLLQHPAVVDAAVVGVDDERTGEAVRAHVVVGGDVGESELKKYCCEHLARYKCPGEIVIEPSLPRGATGKVLRRILR